VKWVFGIAEMAISRTITARPSQPAPPAFWKKTHRWFLSEICQRIKTIFLKLFFRNHTPIWTTFPFLWIDDTELYWIQNIETFGDDSPQPTIVPCVMPGGEGTWKKSPSR
jgi:hypothetical protein